MITRGIENLSMSLQIRIGQDGSLLLCGVDVVHEIGRRVEEREAREPEKSREEQKMVGQKMVGPFSDRFMI